MTDPIVRAGQDVGRVEVDPSHVIRVVIRREVPIDRPPLGRVRFTAVRRTERPTTVAENLLLDVLPPLDMLEKSG